MSADLPRKRSVTIAGHSTSITVEDVFWNGLKTIARAQGKSRQKLIEEIDETREGNLSSAIRVFVFEKTKRQ